MMKKLLLFTLFGVLLSGCNNSIAGKYFNKNSESTEVAQHNVVVDDVPTAVKSYKIEDADNRPQGVGLTDIYGARMSMVLNLDPLFSVEVAPTDNAFIIIPKHESINDSLLLAMSGKESEIAKIPEMVTLFNEAFDLSKSMLDNPNSKYKMIITVPYYNAVESNYDVKEDDIYLIIENNELIYNFTNK